MDSDAREMVASDVIMVFWEKCKTGDFVLTAKLTSYLFSVTKNQTYKFFANKNNKHVDIENVDDFISDGSFETINDGSIYSKGSFREYSYRKVVDTLTDINKATLSLMMDGLSMKEIASEMGYKNSDVVKTKKLKIKNMIKEGLKERNFSEMKI